jgi:hypothetical protein
VLFTRSCLRTRQRRGKSRVAVESVSIEEESCAVVIFPYKADIEINYLFSRGSFGE